MCPSRACSLLWAIAAPRRPRFHSRSLRAHSRSGRPCPAVESPRLSSIPLYLQRRHSMSISTQSIAFLSSSPPRCDPGGTRPVRARAGKRLLGECHSALDKFLECRRGIGRIGCRMYRYLGRQVHRNPTPVSRMWQKSSGQACIGVSRQAIGQGSKRVGGAATDLLDR